MISCEKGNVKISGTEHDILCDLSSIIDVMRKCQVREQDIKRAVEIAFCSEEELKNELVKAMKHLAEIEDLPFFKDIKKALNELMKEAANVRHESTDKSDN
jgi:hypothetical protein